MASRAKVLQMLRDNANYQTLSGSRAGVGGCSMCGCAKSCPMCGSSGGSYIGGSYIGGYRKRIGGSYIGGVNRRKSIGSSSIGGKKRKRGGEVIGGRKKKRKMNGGLSNYVTWRTHFIKKYKKEYGMSPSKHDISNAWEMEK